MISLNLKKRLSADRQGFTIVELLIVIVIIGILAALVVTTYSGIQKKARDTERKTDINALHGQIEAYQAQNGKYPTLANMNDTAFRSDNLKGLDPAALADPNNASSQQLCDSANSSPGCYGYTVVPSDCDNSTTDCTGYTLTADLEGGGTYTKQSLN